MSPLDELESILNEHEEIKKSYPELYRQSTAVLNDEQNSSDHRQSKKQDIYAFEKNYAGFGLDVSVPEFLRPKIARVKSTGAKRVMATRAESTQPQGYHQQQHYNTMPNLESRAEIASAPAPRKKPPLEPLRALKPTPSSSEPFNLADLGPNSDPSNYTSMMVFPLKPSGVDTDSDDCKVPDMLNQSLRSIRKSAKSKRQERTMLTDLSQSFDTGRHRKLNFTRGNTYQDRRQENEEPLMVHGGGGRGHDYNDIFGTNKSRTMPGMNGASFYPGFEFESKKETPTKESTPKRTGTMIKRTNKLSVSPGPSPSKESSSSLTRPSPLSPHNPAKQLNHAMEVLPDFKAHWESTIEQLNVVKNLAMFNREIILPKATEVTNMVIAHCNNIRSKISGAAIDALKDLYRFLKKALIQNLEFGVKSLMAEAGKENMFLREKCEKCFGEIIDAMISSTNGNTAIQKLIAAFQQTIKSKNPIQRSLTAQSFETILTKLGHGRALCDIKDVTDKLILAMNSAFTDTSPDVRYYGKRIVIFLAPHQDFEHVCKKYLSSEDAHRILVFQARGNTTDTLMKSGTMRRSISSGRVTSSRARSSTKPKSPPNTGPGRLMSVSLKDDIALALRSTGHGAKLKIDTLDKMVTVVERSGSLGGDLLSGMDLLCSMTDSAAVANQQAALNNVHHFIPLILGDRIQLSNLITVLLGRLSSNNMNAFIDGARLARDAIETINEQADPVALLSIYAGRVLESPRARQIVAQYQIDMSYAVRERKPQSVVRYGQRSLWVLLQDKTCSNQARQLGEMLYEMIGEDIYKEARIHNLGASLSVKLNLRAH